MSRITPQDLEVKILKLLEYSPLMEEKFGGKTKACRFVLNNIVIARLMLYCFKNNQSSKDVTSVTELVNLQTKSSVERFVRLSAKKSIFVNKRFEDKALESLAKITSSLQEIVASECMVTLLYHLCDIDLAFFILNSRSKRQQKIVNAMKAFDEGSAVQEFILMVDNYIAQVAE